MNGDIASSFLSARGLAECSDILISPSDLSALGKSQVSCPQIRVIIFTPSELERVN